MINTKFKNKILLITGGTGSFGQFLVEYLLQNKFPLKKIIIYSRDELKQFEMKKKFDEKKYTQLRYFIGDIRDLNRLKLAVRDTDYIIHAAALKQVPTAEYNPMEFIKTNIYGAQNLIEACLESKVSRVIALSTDKASSPINLYGATKLCSDKLFITANNIIGKQNIKFGVVRYGNVMGSRGSVLDTFLEQKEKGVISITDKNMTRFNISLRECANITLNALVLLKVINTLSHSGISIPSFKILDLAKAICPNCKIKITGTRPGEKIHEEMISYYDSSATIEKNKYYIIVNQQYLEKYKKLKFKLVKNNFIYRSDLNDKKLSINQIKEIIKNYKNII